jgi:hypothetical protein
MGHHFGYIPPLLFSRTDGDLVWMDGWIWWISDFNTDGDIFGTLKS